MNRWIAMGLGCISLLTLVNCQSNEANLPSQISTMPAKVDALGRYDRSTISKVEFSGGVGGYPPPLVAGSVMSRKLVMELSPSGVSSVAVEETNTDNATCLFAMPSFDSTQFLSELANSSLGIHPPGPLSIDGGIDYLKITFIDGTSQAYPFDSDGLEAQTQALSGSGSAALDAFLYRAVTSSGTCTF